MECFIYYDFEDFRLDVGEEKLLKNGQPVLLTQKNFLILLLLVKNAGQLVRKDEIISAIWHDSFVEESNLTQQIYILRKVLGSNKDGKNFVETVPRRGYRFIGEVSRIEKSEIPKPVSASSDRPEVLTPKTPSEKIPAANKPNAKSSPVFYGAIALILLAIIGAAAFYFAKSAPSEKSGINSIAVLPFKKLGGETDDSKIAFGLADAVINNLSKQQKIPVRSMSAVFQYADKEAFDSVEAGKKLGVDSVLEGTVQREGDEIRVSLRLVKVSDGATVWAEVFIEKLNHIFELQDSISTKVVNSLTVSLPPTDSATAVQKPASAEAFQLYQLGVYFSNTRTPESLRRAVVYFQKTLELDPDYAPAYANLADAYNWQNLYEAGGKRRELLDKSEESANRALAIDNSLAEAHIAKTFVQFVKYRDYEGGRKSLEKAVAFAPYNPTARLHYGWELLQSGDLEGAYRETLLAQQYSPLSALNNLNLCTILMFKKDYAQALQFCRKSAEIQPTMPAINIQIANILYLSGKPDEAVNLLKLESENPAEKYSALGSLAHIYGKTGKITEAAKIYEQLKNADDSFIKYSDLALLGFALGKKEEAIENLKKAVEVSAIPPTYLVFDPFWEEILKEQEIRQLVSR